MSAPIVAAALAAHDRGWIPVRVAPRGKRPVGERWQTLRPTPREIATWAGSNLGVLLGESSGWLTDTDLDCDEAVELAPHYLPPTWVYGRPSKPRSHWLYGIEGARSHAFRDEAGAVLLEVRGASSGHQSVIPPSVHPSGEAIEWDADMADATDGPRVLDRRDYVAAVGALARATIYRRAGATVEEARQLAAEHVPAPPPRPTASRGRAASTATATVARARAYLAALPPAVAHSGGHMALWHATLALVRGFRLDEQAALDLLAADYSPRCDPPWSERELSHKVRQAASASRVGDGYLLDGGGR